MNTKTLNLKEYRCRKCGRLFYIDAVERRPFDLDFGCPYGCDDNGEHIRVIVIRADEMAVGPDVGTGIKDHRIVIELCQGDFERSMARKPRDQNEFDDWAALTEKGLLNGHIDWDILYGCTCDAMQYKGDDNE